MLWIIAFSALILLIIGGIVYFSLKSKNNLPTLSTDPNQANQIAAATQTYYGEASQAIGNILADQRVTKEEQIAEIRRLLVLYDQDLNNLRSELDRKRVDLEKARLARSMDNSEPITLGSRAQVTDALLSKRLAESQQVQNHITELTAESDILRERLNQLTLE